MKDPVIGDTVKVRLSNENRTYTIIVSKLFPEYRLSTVDANPWWIEGWTKSGKTCLRFSHTEIV